MKSNFYIHVFAGISIVALSLHVFSSFWMPLTIGAFAMTILAVLLRK
jgi:hypothetical protein